MKGWIRLTRPPDMAIHIRVDMVIGVQAPGDMAVHHIGALVHMRDGVVFDIVESCDHILDAIAQREERDHGCPRSRLDRTTR